MRSLLGAVLILVSGISYGSIPTVLCGDCTSLREFGNFGAAQLWRAVGATGPEVGTDKIWVRNPSTNRRAFVDVDRPYLRINFLGIPLVIPDLSKQEVNATWDDASASATWVLPNEVIGAIEEAFDVAESEQPSEPNLSIPGFDSLPGINDLVWQVTGNSIRSGLWTFHFSTLFGGYPNAVVSVVECEWLSGC
jgi:hypothetical protein